MATGRGRTLGEALINAFKAFGWQSGREAKGWHARLSALTKTARGQEALLAAGVAAGDRARNWREWLAEDRAPNKANQEKIAEAYARWRLPRAIRTATAKISGEIRTEGRHARNRGIDEAPLTIDHRGGGSAAQHDQRWNRIEAKWVQGVNDEDFEEAYADEVIDADLDFSEFETGGSGYTVVIA